MLERETRKQRMPNLRSSARLWVTAGILLGAFVLLHSVSHGEPIIQRQALRDLPYTVNNWSGEEYKIDDKILKAVGVTDYANRVYSQPGGSPVGLYIGYYGSQRTGDTIHSPKNCLPGAGWEPVKSGTAELTLAGGRKIVVNEYVIQQDLDKELVFYWYQGRGRVIASEYEGKFWMVADAITRKRTDGALVRLITPINDGETKAFERLSSFAQDAFPEIEQILPK
jgi:EpsI family protein